MAFLLRLALPKIEKLPLSDFFLRNFAGTPLSDRVGDCLEARKKPLSSSCQAEFAYFARKLVQHKSWTAHRVVKPNWAYLLQHAFQLVSWNFPLSFIKAFIFPRFGPHLHMSQCTITVSVSTLTKCRHFQKPQRQL